MAILKFLDNIIDSLDRGGYAATIFLDFSKAFDTVNHHILLQKLSHYGIRGTANKWFESYLSNRSQFCTFGGKQSDEAIISCGVPQGSILGPLLFLIYINDLGTIFQNLSTVLFADDSNLIASGNSIETLERKINQDIPLLTKWLQTNRLSLNIKKTHVMVFGRKSKNQTNDLSVTIEGTKLELVKHTKFLGVILDNEINWKQHILHISQKLSKSLGILKRARQFLNTSTLLQLYYSFLYPYLSYCCIIWGNAAQTTLWPIFRSQKYDVRILTNTRRRDSSKPSFTKLRILRLPDIYKTAVLTFVYKYKNGHLPPTFDNFFSYNGDNHRYPTRAATQLRIPLTKTKHSSSFVRKTGVSLWNQYEGKISSQQTFGQFKRILRDIFISSYIAA